MACLPVPPPGPESEGTNAGANCTIAIVNHSAEPPLTIATRRPLKTACLPVPPPGRARNIESFRHEVQAVLAKALRSPFTSLASLHVSITWWCLDRQRIDQAAGNHRHVRHGAVERRLVRSE